jgi:CheY-like chemotaxis protein
MSKNILVIDDSVVVRDKIATFLNEMGYSTITAENGSKALEAIAHNSEIGLILCDINMPEMNGIEFCRNLSKRTGKLEVPVFLLTTEVSEELKTIARKLGVRAWITKPFEPEILSQALRHVFPISENSEERCSGS